MKLHEFISLCEQAKTRQPAELAAIPCPNPLLAHYTFFSALEGLRKDWRELAPGKDPGKYKPHRFWVSRFDRSQGKDAPITFCQPFWPREVIDDLREAERGMGTASHAGDVPYPLGSLADVAVRDCPDCKTPGPVIGTYMQTRNSIEFDEWQLSLAVLCVGCAAARPFHRQSECRRFARDVLARYR